MWLEISRNAAQQSKRTYSQHCGALETNFNHFQNWTYGIWLSRSKVTVGGLSWDTLHYVMSIPCLTGNILWKYGKGLRIPFIRHTRNDKPVHLHRNGGGRPGAHFAVTGGTGVVITAISGATIDDKVVIMKSLFSISRTYCKETLPLRSK